MKLFVSTFLTEFKLFSPFIFTAIILIYFKNVIDSIDVRVIAAVCDCERFFLKNWSFSYSFKGKFSKIALIGYTQ